MDSNFKYRVEVPAWHPVRVAPHWDSGSRKTDLDALRAWCRQNVGSYARDWIYLPDSSNIYTFCFRDEASATLFKLVIPR